MTYILTLLWCLWTPQQPLSCEPTSFTLQQDSAVYIFDDSCAAWYTYNQANRTLYQLQADQCRVKSLVKVELKTVEQ